MTTNKIKIAKDKANLVKALLDESETTGPFQTYADVMACRLGSQAEKAIAPGCSCQKRTGPDRTGNICLQRI